MRKFFSQIATICPCVDTFGALLDFMNIFGRDLLPAECISVAAAAVVDRHYVIPHTIFMSGNNLEFSTSIDCQPKQAHCIIT